jgi:superfamily I DNA/RNA helicase/RecB family exonuclease
MSDVSVAGAGPAIRLVAPRPLESGIASPDPSQAALIDRVHGSGSVVLFGAPGSGKTTALVEAVAARVRRDGLDPGSVLALAPTRAAAVRLRDLLSARVGGTVREPMARTPYSYAFGVLRKDRVLGGEPPPRLISGAEQDRVLAELLEGHEEGWADRPAWPTSTTDEIRLLRGFRDELRDLLMRAVERGLSPGELERLGLRNDRPDWIAAAQVLAEYTDVTSLSTPGAYDAAGIVDAAAHLLHSDPGLLDAEHRERRLIVVDDAQELTVATQRLLLLLAQGGSDVLLAGDPDAATQSFRGARPRAMADVADLLPAGAGRPLTRLRLMVAHRHPPALRAVSARIADRIGSSGAFGHRSPKPADAGPEADPSAVTPSSVQVEILASPAREAAYIAQYLRRHHLEDSAPWRKMAVIVRSARSTAALRRALSASGIPVAVPAAQVPIQDEPAVVPLRLMLRCALDDTEPLITTALDLLAGPIGGADAIALRRLRQALRSAELAGGGGRGSDALLLEVLHEPTRLAPFEPGVSAPARRVAAVIEAGRTAAADPLATPESVLWAIWTATGLDRSWHRAALSGGAAGARADRDLDAVMALFEVAGRFTDRFPRAGAAGFLEYLEGQEVPMDTLAERSPSDEAVALVTAQGAAGLEWDVVAVAGVQEGTWPDLRLRDSLLGAQRVADLVDGRAGAGGPDGETTYLAARRAVMDDELRLFHVAVSRPRRHLLVTAVRSDDEMPSAFVDLVDPDGAVQEIRPLAEVPRGMTLPALVAELRSALAEPEASATRRTAAARQLARLALAGVPGADPADWYGLAPVSSTGPLRPGDQAVRISPSAVESFDRCSLRWLLEQSGGRAASSPAQGVGLLVHELAHEVPDGDEPRLMQLLEERFDRLGLGRGWVADSERARARQMVSRLAQYVARAREEGRELVATELQVAADIDRAQVRGMVDRLERDADGRLVIVDLKTGKTPPSAADVGRNAQLGVYQVTVEEGGFDRVARGVRESGGAALAQLGAPGAKLKVQPQPPLSQESEPLWARELLATVADGMAAENFPARSNSMCRVCPVRRSCPLHIEGRGVVE